MSGIFDWLVLEPWRSLLVPKPKPEPKEVPKMPLGQAHSMLQFFEKLPISDLEKQELEGIRAMYLSLAQWIEATLPSNPERTTALRKLLESKDCAVRARVFKGP